MKLIQDKHVRRNIMDLRESSPAEFGRFIVALRNLEVSDDWARICGIHGNTFNAADSEVKCPTDPKVVEKIGNTPDEPFYCAHSETKFIAWHTPYIYNFELLLNKHNTSKNTDYISLPYLWLTNDNNDYSFVNELEITVLFDDEHITIKNPLAAENVTYYDEKSNKKIVQRNGFLQPRDATEIRKVAATNKELNNVLYSESYPMFSSNTLYTDVFRKLIEFNPLEIPHNNVHDFIGGKGGNMGEVSISAYDPLFWLHHCNMDRFFYNWLFNHTDGFSRNFLPPRIPTETLHGTLAPFFDADVHSDDFANYSYGWQNASMSFLKIENVLNLDKFPYTYEKIDIQPYRRPNVAVEITGMPIPMETTHIEVLLFPKGTTITDENKKDYVAGSATWFGINRYIKCCKRCNKSRTNMKIDIEDYLDEHNIDTNDLGNYTWMIEGNGRLHPDEDDEFRIYAQEDLIKDGNIELVVQDSSEKVS